MRQIEITAAALGTMARAAAMRTGSIRQGAQEPSWRDSLLKGQRLVEPASVGMPITSPEAWMGRWALCPVQLERHDGETLQLPDAVCQLQLQHHIVCTQLEGMEGTVKEYTATGDYEISLQVGVWSDSQDWAAYPEEGVMRLRSFLTTGRALRVQSGWLDLFGISRMVVKGFSLAQATHSNCQVVAIQALSDVEVDLTGATY